MTIERDLRDALRRPEPPSGYDERVMDRIAAERDARASVRFGATRSQWAAAAMLLLILGAGGWGGYRWEQQRRVERAAEEVLTALRITSEKLNLALETIEEQSPE